MVTLVEAASISWIGLLEGFWSGAKNDGLDFSLRSAQSRYRVNLERVLKPSLVLFNHDLGPIISLIGIKFIALPQKILT